MSRPVKTGLDYFLSDVSFWDDGKIMDLTNTYGPMGVCIYDVVLRQVYKNGYYLETSLDALAGLVIRTIGNRWIKNKNLVLQVMQYCAEIGLLDHALLSQSVITSVGIQQRYDQVTARNKVDKTKYWLLEKKDVPAACQSAPPKSVSAAETGVSATETPVSAQTIRQRREEKKREEENREDQSRVCSVIEIPCRNGTFSVDEDFLDELTHTYPEMDVMESLKHLVTYLLSNPGKQRFRNAAGGTVRWWVQEDNDHHKYRKKHTIPPTYDIGEYESTSVLDEEDAWGDNSWLLEELATDTTS